MTVGQECDSGRDRGGPACIHPVREEEWSRCPLRFFSAPACRHTSRRGPDDLGAGSRRRGLPEVRQAWGQAAGRALPNVEEAGPGSRCALGSPRT